MILMWWKIRNDLGSGIITVAVDEIATGNIPCAIIRQLLMEMVVLWMVTKKGADTSTFTAEIIDVDTRDNYLLMLNDAIQYLHHKAVNGRIRDAKNEKVRIDYFRALVYAISTANGVYKDKQLDKMEKDIEMLKNMYIEDSGKPDGNKLSPTAQAELDEIDAKIEKFKEKSD